MEIFCSIIRANPLIVAFHSTATAGCYEMSFQLCLKKPIMHIPLAAIKVCVLEGMINFHTKIVKNKLSIDFRMTFYVFVISKCILQCISTHCLYSQKSLITMASQQQQQYSKERISGFLFPFGGEAAYSPFLFTILSHGTTTTIYGNMQLLSTLH